MSLNYLMSIRGERFPFTVTDVQEIRKIIALQAATLVVATVPARSTEWSSYGEQPPATIHGLTRMGRMEIEKTLRKLSSPRRIAPAGSMRDRDADAHHLTSTRKR